MNVLPLRKIVVAPGRMGTSSRLFQQTIAAAVVNINSAFAVRTFGSTSCPCRRGQQSGTGRTNGLLLKKSSSSSSCRPTLLMQSFSIASSSVSSSPPPPNLAGKEGWDLYAGVVVERKPMLTQKKDVLQEKYANYVAQMEFEMSKLSDHEIRHFNDIKMLEKVKAGEIDLGNVQTARDAEDRWTEKFENFKPASRETAADLKKDVRSLERALDSQLLLLVEQKLGNDYRWICPHSKLMGGETLRQAAERMMHEIFPEMKMKVLGHAPWGFYKYKYPKEFADQSVGAKVFFYKAQVVSGETHLPQDNTTVKDFVWLKRDELPSKLQPEYFKHLSECLTND